jgi:integrase
VLLSTFGGLRLGELQALTKRRLDLDARVVSIVEQTQLLKDGTLVTSPPKTAAGVRSVNLPEAIIEELRGHLHRFSARGPDGLVFCGAYGQPFRRASLYTAWYRALKAVGIEGLRIHDLRHTGNTLAAMTGASTKELMARMGHASPRAALIYQHATSGRDKAIADALDRMIRSADPAEHGRSAAD